MTIKNKTEEQIYREALKLAEEIEKECDGVETEVSLDTMEGEDAYIWVHVTPDKLDRARVVASGITAQSDAKGFLVVPRMKIKVSLKGSVRATGKLKAVKEKRSSYTSKKAK